MIDPPIISDQNLVENFKFKIKPGHGKMILITRKTFTREGNYLVYYIAVCFHF